MDFRSLCVPLVSLLALAASPCPASEWTGYASAGPSAWEFGLGTSINDSLALRAGLGRQHPSAFDRGVAGATYRVQPQPSDALSLMADWFPVRDSGLRLTGGLVYLPHSSQALGQDSTGGYRINGHDYTADTVGTLAGRANASHLQPYLGVGWQSSAPSKPGLHFISDIGVRFAHGGHASLSSSAGKGNPALQGDIAADRQRLDHDLGGTRFNLGLSVGLAFTF